MITYPTSKMMREEYYVPSINSVRFDFFALGQFVSAFVAVSACDLEESVRIFSPKERSTYQTRSPHGCNQGNDKWGSIVVDTR